MSSPSTIDLTAGFLEAFRSNSPSTGFTHTYYRYPARFSPQFVRAAILAFSKPGDLILDPFMGSGTTLVESLANGRQAIGTDINPLAHFLALAKTSLLSTQELMQIEIWAARLYDNLNNFSGTANHSDWAALGYQKNLPWYIRKTIESILDAIGSLRNLKQKRFARCALLRTGQWALDCTTQFPTSTLFKAQYLLILHSQVTGMLELQQNVQKLHAKPLTVCLDVAAAQLNANLWSKHINGKPKLVITSPPYPSVHVLYHRWQILGRKETASPYWIIGEPDGHTESYYTMGGRSVSGVDVYFRNLEDSFTNIHGLLSRNAMVVQLISFSEAESQLPRYLEVMQRTGFEKVDIRIEETTRSRHVWRKVPLRRWYANYKGNIASAKELLLIHRKID